MRGKKKSQKVSRSSAGVWTSGMVVLFGLFFGAHLLPKSSPPPIVIENTGQPRWDQLVTTLSEIVDGYQGEVGLYIKDLKTGKTFERQADQEFVSASLIKLPIMVATFQAILDGKISLQDQIRLKRGLRRAGSGQLKWARTGTIFPLSHLIYAMMTHSDNTATAMIIDRLGYEYLNRNFEKFGLSATRIHPTGMSLSNRLDPALDNYTTPREMGLLLEKIYKHQLADDGLSDLMLQIMKGANSRNRLAKDLPPSWSLARKTGLLRKNCHDVGIIFSPSGDYVICVLTSQNRNYKMAKGFIASVGRTAYEILNNNS